MHRAPKNDNAYLSLTYDEKLVSYMFLKHLREPSEETFTSANDFIVSWIEFSENTLAAKDIKVEKMHHEQFGILMYHLYHVCKHKDTYIDQNRITPHQAQTFPGKDFSSQLAFTRRDSFDRIFPLCWLEIIGYPPFWDFSIYDEAGYGQSNATFGYLMRLLVVDLNKRLKISNSDIKKLQAKI